MPSVKELLAHLLAEALTAYLDEKQVNKPATWINPTASKHSYFKNKELKFGVSIPLDGKKTYPPEKEYIGKSCKQIRKNSSNETKIVTFEFPKRTQTISDHKESSKTTGRSVTAGVTLGFPELIIPVSVSGGVGFSRTTTATEGQSASETVEYPAEENTSELLPYTSQSCVMQMVRGGYYYEKSTTVTLCGDMVVKFKNREVIPGNTSHPPSNKQPDRPSKHKEWAIPGLDLLTIFFRGKEYKVQDTHFILKAVILEKIKRKLKGKTEACLLKFTNKKRRWPCYIEQKKP